MSLAVAILALLAAGVRADTARIVGSTLVVEPVGLHIVLPPEWFGASDSIAWPPTCGHDVHGPVDQRLVTSRPILDSLRHHAQGEWDREYVAVADSTLPFENLVAQVGPEPLGTGTCFLDLQVRVYVLPDRARDTAALAAAGLRTARAFFPSATIVARDSAEWHIERLRWDAWYYDYGGEANVETYRTEARGRTVVLVFMHASQAGGPADRDERFILQHVRLR
ncbi:MAG TPA: hypothetical protein VHB25_17455 [Gemmatimonadaceae bacterium]|nr:hypothetical protein [Gemmatimonadaceae bacterium]